MYLMLQFDGNCDKIVPGLMIGALRHGHLPMIFISGGPMATGISNTEKSIKRKAFAAQEIDKIELMELSKLHTMIKAHARFMAPPIPIS